MDSDHDAQAPGDQNQSGSQSATAGSGRGNHHVSFFRHVPHPHIARRKEEGPVRVADQMPRHNPLVRFNSRFALLITLAVGSMWCAYIFIVLSLVSLPAAIQSHDSIVIVAWISQTFFQLVLLPIIIVGQNIQGEAADMRAQQTYNDAEAVLHEALQIQEHLSAQDTQLLDIIKCLMTTYPDAFAPAVPTPE
jgi:hypothetical protein